MSKIDNKLYYSKRKYFWKNNSRINVKNEWILHKLWWCKFDIWY